MFKRPVQTFVLLIPLALFAIIKGVIPAFTQIQTDFPNYYIAGAIARTGVGVERLYDDAWFQEQIKANGMDQQGKFSPFPPPTALLFVPLSLLEPLTALRIVTLVNMLLLALSIWILSKLFSLSLVEATTFVLLSGWGLVNCFRFGQLYIALSLSMLVSYYLLQRKKAILSGVSAASLLPIKYFSVVLLIHFALRREWKTLLAAFVTIALVVCISIATLGWKIHEEWLLTVLGQHLQSNLSQQDPFSSVFQSFDSLLRRLFVYNATWNTAPLVNAPALYVTLKLSCIIAAIAIAGCALVVITKKTGSTELALVILCLLGLVIAPATATYHYLLLWLPLGILLSHFRSTDNKRYFWLTLVLYSSIGFLPYSFFRQFDGEGVLTFLAYPRLFLLILLFGVSVAASLRQPRLNSIQLSSVR